MYILQSRQFQSSPFQLLNFLLNTAKFSDFFKLSGNACQSNEPRNDTDSIPYTVVLAFGNCRVYPLLRLLFSIFSTKISFVKLGVRFFLVLKFTSTTTADFSDEATQNYSLLKGIQNKSDYHCM